MYKASASSLLALLCALSQGAWAAEEIEPGLWEVSTQLTPEHAAQLSADGRAAGLRGGVIVSTICITRDNAAAKVLAVPDEGYSCKSHKPVTRGSTTSVQVLCEGSDRSGTGSASTEVADARSFRSTYQFSGVQHGLPFVERYESRARWIAAACAEAK